MSCKLWVLLGAVALAACSADGSDAGTSDLGTPDLGTPDLGTDAGAAVDSGPSVDGGGDAGTDAGEIDAGMADAGRPNRAEDCDPLQPEVCTFPWPSNLYLSPDSNRVTGHALRFGPTSLPANRAGRHVDPAPFSRLDGYGVGTPIMMLFPNLDFAGSGLADEGNIGASLDPNAPILLFEDTGKGYRLVPTFAELDLNESDPALKTLFVRPARVLEEATRYVVAVRRLRATDGSTYAPSLAFVALRDAATANDPLLAPRQARFDTLFTMLEGQGIARGSLQLAWDFVTGSSGAVHGRMLAMRDQALAAVGSDGPAVTISSVTAYVPSDDGSGRPVDPNMRFRVEGEVAVPSYLRAKTIASFTHTVLNVDQAGVPVQSGSHAVHFWMIVPHSTSSATVSHGLIQYGHGLLGSGSQTTGEPNRVIANRYHYVIFGCDLIGLSEQDELAVGIAVSDMSGFEWVGDTLHQGLLDYLVVGRAISRRLGALTLPGNVSLNIDSSAFYYSGISQGGIMGGSYMALSTDVTRGHLGVPGANYNLLLHRSVDFEPFFEMLAAGYPSSIDQAVVLGLAQLEWDSTDPISYYRHIAQQPFANTPSHQVLAAPAKGDYQVAVLSMEILARSNLGLSVMDNYDDQRTPYGITLTPYPLPSGSGMVLYDFGNPWPPAGNLPPNDGLSDPHGLPRRLREHSIQMDHFFRTGEIIDVCGADGCHPN